MNCKIVKIICYFLLFLILYISIFKEYNNITNIQIMGITTFADIFLSKQKMLFNNTLLFATFLYITQNSFLKSVVIIRYEKNFTREIVLNSLIKCLAFTSLIYLSAFISFYFIFDNIDLGILRYSIVVLPFFLRISLIYNFIYYIKQNYTYSFIFVILESIIILIAYIGLGFVGINIEIVPDIITNPIYCLGISLALCVVITVTSRRRDYI